MMYSCTFSQLMLETNKLLCFALQLNPFVCRCQFSEYFVYFWWTVRINRL